MSGTKFHFSGVSVNGSNISVASTGPVRQTLNAQSRPTRSQLMAALSEAGLPQAQQDSLTDALDRDGADRSAPGPAVRSWLGETRQQLTASLVTTVWALVTGYFGLPAAS
ncbi:hypothetical protein AB0C65_35730 [Nocardia sp. NPDC048505]|uniref:hypothetical protein n=1 Tax=Nocardia sp. NPDC048505 TaxID=3155756 RepID=UPI00340E875E